MCGETCTETNDETLPSALISLLQTLAGFKTAIVSDFYDKVFLTSVSPTNDCSSWDECVIAALQETKEKSISDLQKVPHLTDSDVYQLVSSNGSVMKQIAACTTQVTRVRKCVKAHEIPSKPLTPLLAKVHSYIDDYTKANSLDKQLEALNKLSKECGPEYKLLEPFAPKAPLSTGKSVATPAHNDCQALQDSRPGNDIGTAIDALRGAIKNVDVALCATTPAGMNCDDFLIPVLGRSRSSTITSLEDKLVKRFGTTVSDEQRKVSDLLFVEEATLKEVRDVSSAMLDMLKSSSDNAYGFRGYSVHSLTGGTPIMKLTVNLRKHLTTLADEKSTVAGIIEAWISTLHILRDLRKKHGRCCI